jgi:spermidine synthase
MAGHGRRIRPSAAGRAGSRTGMDAANALAGRHEIDTGTAELVVDPADPDGVLLSVNDVPSSYVHADPTRLDFEYMQWFGDVLEAWLPAPEPLKVTHIGGAGCTMARYIAATRPGSTQVVYEIDAALATLARQAFGLRQVTGVRIRAEDGRTGLAGAPAGVADVVIRDAFAGALVPPHLTTTGWLHVVKAALAPGGLYVANVADQTQLALARREAVTAAAAFAHVALVAEPGQLRGRRYGNVVLLASDAALPQQALTRRLASGAVRARYVPPARVAELTSGQALLVDPV